MRSKFGVITFAASQMRSEEIVLREPNFTGLENSLRESKKKITHGGKMIAGLIVATAAAIVAGLYIQKPKPIPVKITKRS